MYILESEDLCSGCFACKNICPTRCIDMIENEEGFKYPKIEQSKCINCKKCREVCPINNSSNIKQKEKPGVYAIKNRDEYIRSISTSGGFFTALALKILKENGAVFGAELDNKLNVIHSYIEKAEDLERYNGSKYVQSDTDNVYYEITNLLKERKTSTFFWNNLSKCSNKKLFAFKKS